MPGFESYFKSLFQLRLVIPSFYKFPCECGQLQTHSGCLYRCLLFVLLLVPRPCFLSSGPWWQCLCPYSLSIYHSCPCLALTFFEETAAIRELGMICIMKLAIGQISPGSMVFSQYLMAVMRYTNSMFQIGEQGGWV